MHRIEIQYAVTTQFPDRGQLKKWARSAIQPTIASAEITIRIVDIDEITSLNASYRNKNKPTNVLSFPLDISLDNEQKRLVGDVIICADIVEREAKEQNKTLLAHWAHMVIHGTLHLQGYDHIEENEAIKMESLETDIMKKLGFPAPYEGN